MNVKKNYLYNMLYQSLVFILPLITVPYTSRVFGTGGTGAYAYTTNIANYFLLFGLLGIAVYGNRQIARNKDDENTRNRTFSKIYYGQLAASSLSCVAYFGMIFLFPGDHFDLSLLQGLVVFSSVFDITWLYYGIGDFKTTTIRNISFRVASIALIFMFVKSPEDLWLYTLIRVSSTFLGQICLWFAFHKKARFVRVPLTEILAELKQSLIFFIPIVANAATQYTDKVLIGNTSGMDEVGIYYNSQLLLDIPLTVIISLGTVMLPFLSTLLTKGEHERHKKYFRNTLFFILFVNTASALGVAAVAPEITFLLFGEKFAKCALYIPLLCPKVFLISWNNTFRMQYIIPTMREKIYIRAFVIGAVTNLAINFSLIPFIGVYGAIIGAIAAEVAIALVQTLPVRRELEIKKFLLQTIPMFAAGLIMYAAVRLTGSLMATVGSSNGYRALTLAAEVLVGVAVYALLAGGFFLITRNESALSLLEAATRRFRRKKTGARQL